MFLLALLGCDESVHPYVGDERPFTLWGFMDAGADTQQVRIFTIEERLGLDRSGPIDAVVTSTDLDTGEQRPWHDREVTFADSSVGHVFWAAFRAEFGHRYRLEVASSDGAVSSVEVVVPGPVELLLDRDTDRTTVPATILGSPPRPIKVEVEYDVSTVTPANPWPPGSTYRAGIRFPVALSYTDELDPIEGGWEMEIDMNGDYSRVQDEFERNCLVPDLIALRRIELRLLVASEDWDPPGGTFDPDVLVQPGAFSNVENGFGFFGGGFTVSERWTPNIDLLRTIGYTFEAPCAFGPQDIPACQLPPEPCFDKE